MTINNDGYKEILDAACIYSNVECDGKKIDYGVTTDSGNSTLMLIDGNKVDVTPKTSLECVGEKVQDNEPAKTIQATNGNIQLEAKNGDIILKAKNIRIVAEDGSGEITITSTKIISINAPYIKQNGTNITVTASGNVETFGNTISSSAQIKNCSMSSVDMTQGSFLGQASSGLKGLKKFFKDCFGVG